MPLVVLDFCDTTIIRVSIKFRDLVSLYGSRVFEWFCKSSAIAIARGLVERCVLGKTIVMVLLCHSSECGCFVCFA